ncbi:hypothetical protein AA637_08340 [Cyanobacterium sp. HL-69]|uniref:hypothetical protein n=1 Tax=Cyanobacterium sp. IPPAS B-1200 TaxID=1562720 RepID=UPI000CA10B7F|nr:hypothetical protein [Cyanobacterium sp. IPPAS B-1200]AUC61167.1 hypothetical protein AA637_08340 [Cyanobacterium sp. HL-69]
MEASGRSRNNQESNPRQITANIFGTTIALTTLIVPLLLITNFSDKIQNPSLQNRNIMTLTR